MSTEITLFSTDESDECFMNGFALASSVMLEGVINKPTDLYDNVGMCWAAAEMSCGPRSEHPAFCCTS